MCAQRQPQLKETLTLKAARVSSEKMARVHERRSQGYYPTLGADIDQQKGIVAKIRICSTV